MAPKPRFADGEKVLCFHGPLLYEAKCMKCQIKEKNVKYFIHYSGWNKNWDEWVPESRVLKYNDVNMQKQKELEAAHTNKVKKSKAGKSGSKKEPSDRESTALPPQERTQKQKNKEAAASTSTESQAEIQRKKRTRAEQNVETEEEFTQKLEVKVKNPDELKHRLVEDWDLVTRQKKLVHLPARVPVETIISDYIKQRVSVKGMTPNKETAILETTNGIREYFNVMLGKQLLYKFERPQHAELLAENPDMTPSQIYGAVHLLRLFNLFLGLVSFGGHGQTLQVSAFPLSYARIGGALAYTVLDEDTISLITSNLYDFQKFMAKSAVNLFASNDYIPATADYLKKVG